MGFLVTKSRMACDLLISGFACAAMFQSPKKGGGSDGEIVENCEFRARKRGLKLEAKMEGVVDHNANHPSSSSSIAFMQLSTVKASRTPTHSLPV